MRVPRVRLGTRQSIIDVKSGNLPGNETRLGKLFPARARGLEAAGAIQSFLFSEVLYEYSWLERGAVSVSPRSCLVEFVRGLLLCLLQAKHDGPSSPWRDAPAFSCAQS